MIDLFTIFGKGGIVLWCFQEGSDLFRDTINDFIQDVILQERGNTKNYSSNGVTLKYKLDNEFEIVFLVVYRNLVQLTYMDKLLNEISLRFRDMYKNVLVDSNMLHAQNANLFKSFDKEFNKILNNLFEEEKKLAEIAKKPRTYQESAKSKKTMESVMNLPAKKAEKPLKKPTKAAPKKEDSEEDDFSSIPQTPSSDADDETMARRAAMMKKVKGKAKMPASSVPTIEKSPEQGKKKGKQARNWDYPAGNGPPDVLDYSRTVEDDAKSNNGPSTETNTFVEEQRSFVGTYKGDLPGLDVGESSDEEENEVTTQKSGWFSSLSNLVSNKKLTPDDIEPIMTQMKENLIQKNVAAEPADQICESVGNKLNGKVIGTFNRVKTIVKEAMRESLVQLLTPKRRVDILRDIAESKKERRPYVIVFCGVNGVGKSTNLSKVTFWLNENGHKVLIAAGDTFRAGAVEQLRTHMRNLNSLHPEAVTLYEQGYGKDPAGLAAAAIGIAADRGIDVVLVDTAGRMQDNEPLMRSLSKLIKINEPDLVLFVGEALVGNEAVDQLVKFNQALADNSDRGKDARLIDGIVLTKFDTIDDKVGAAISMTYITGQPIVFVGCGQTYTDLKSLNVNAVVHSLLR
uniref:SRP54 domain-containing protein n=1 Tax=Rhabditophanes sp. KR3021 TaxID=114890 RepID=A0AC35TV37_9BILA